MEYDEEILGEFLTEMSERLADLEISLQDLEISYSRDTLNSLFRSVHTIKGGAGFFNLKKIEKLSHVFEENLITVREGEVPFDASKLPVYFAVCDKLREMQDSEDLGESQEIDSLCEKLDSRKETHTNFSQSELQRNIDATEYEIENPMHTSLAATALDTDSRDDEPILSLESENREQLGANVRTNILSDSNVKVDEVPLQKKQAQETIRVRVDLLNRLMELTGEIVVGRNQLLRQFADVSDKTHLLQMAHMVSDLQQLVIQTRMQAIGGTFTKFHKIGRDMSKTLNKPLRVITSGEETELDRTIIESLSDPLTHLVRNCADHGIESPEDRIRQGKRPEGTIQLTAKKSGGQVIVNVRDDGKGIDPKQIVSKAIQNGVIDHESANQLRDQDALRLIFEPGFSTAETVSNISGRGVGMDVVRSTVEKLGGTIDVESGIGEGTSVVIHLPTTLMIMSSLIVEIDRDVFVVPMTELKEVILVNPQDEVQIENIMGRYVYRLRETLIPILTMTDLIETGSAVDSNASRTDKHSESSIYENRIKDEALFLVMASGTVSFGLLIDEVHHTEEVVVKPISQVLKHLNIYAGSSILGDSTVAMVLSSNGICKNQNLDTNDLNELFARQETGLERENIDFQELQDLLIFSYSDNEQLAIPLSLVHKVNQFDKSQIEKIGNSSFLNVDGKNLMLIFMGDHLGLSEIDENTSTLYLICPKLIDVEFGIVAKSIEESVHLRLTLDTPPMKNEEVLGVTSINGKITLVLDLFTLAEKISPESYKASQAFDRHQKNRLLVVDDTPFYRDLERRYFESVGFNVETAANGSEAFDILTADPTAFDLVITDIVMPFMDGYELVRVIKNSPDLHKIPVVALTSYFEEEHREKAIQAGFTGYSIKTNKESIISAVDGFLDQAQRTRP